jgi:prolyl 4-hydroxylase
MICRVCIVLFLCLLYSTLFHLVENSEVEGSCESSADKQCQNNQRAKIAKGSNAQGKPPEALIDSCEDRSEKCPIYKLHGHCSQSPGWMIVNCPKTCNACHLRSYQARCERSSLNISTDPIYFPGSVSAMFLSLTERFGDRYDINVLSTSPWVVTFDNFLTDEEAEALISTVEGTWEHSTDTGAVNAFGETGRTLSKGRTSSNAWCKEKCSSHSLVQNVVSKMAEVTLVPSNHYESLQILHYEKGQFYRKHHDMGL